jgi:methionyl-tRNA formyltransferase
VRTVYLGTSAFAAVVLERLADSPHRPALVVTRPDRPKGRGRQVSPPPVAVRARDLGLDVIQPERLHEPEALDRIAAVEPEVACVCAYGVLIKEPLFSAYEMINVHPSLLPRWRGAAPVERAIMAGDAETGVSIIRLVEELDAGPIGASASFPIGADDDAGAVFARAADLAPNLVDEALEGEFREQEGEESYAEKIGPADRELDWSRPPAELHNRIRALSPHIGARGELHGRPVIVWRSRLGHDGSLELLEVQPEGRRRMSLAEFERGLRR